MYFKASVYRAIFSLTFLLASISVTSLTAQTLMPLPNHSSVYSGPYARGYWFTAPTSFVITGLRVANQAGTSPQYIQVVKLNVTPPISSGSQTTNFTTLVYISSAPNNVIQSVNIPVTAGDVIGVLGTSGTSNSYGNGAYTTNIYGNSVTLQRFGYQGDLTGGATTQVWGVGQGLSGSIGRVELYYGSPCAGATNLAVSNVSSTRANFSWSAVTGSQGYDYIVDQNPVNPTGTPTFTNNTNGSVTGLTPSTLYYLHVRNYCTSTSKSAWDTVSFTTLPPCAEAQNLTYNNIDSTSANFSWTAQSTDLSYVYAVDTNRTPPSLNNTTATTTAFGGASNLTEGMKYYVHIKTYCVENDSSSWYLDSFYTPIVCRAPQVAFSNVNSSRAVASWDPVPSALEYEYVLSTNATQPSTVGSKTVNDFVLLPYLKPGTTHYLYVKSNCSDRGVLSSSKWDVYQFNTHALSIGRGVGSEDILKVYPSPAKDVLFIDYVAGIKPHYELFDVSGKLVKVVDADSGQQTLSVNVSDLPSGFYTVKYESEQSGIGYIKFIKE